MSAPTRPEATGASRSPAAERVVGLRRLTAVSAVLFVLVLADACYMQFSNYQSGTFNNFHLSDAATVFVAAGLLAVTTVLLGALTRRAMSLARP